VVWWVVFLAELVALLAVAIQWRLAARRGREGWLGRVAERLAAAAQPAGAARLASDPRLPHSEKANRRVQHYGWLACGALVALPAFAAVATNHLSIQLAVGAWFLALYCCIDVAAAGLVVLMLWLGWMPPFDDGGGGGDELLDPEPRPDGPWARAHVFDLSR
jgi:hypothetical protein